MHRKRASLLLIFWLGLSSSLPVWAETLASGKARAIAYRIERVLQDNRNGQVQGLSLAVSIDGEVVLATGIGEAAPGVPAAPETLYFIGSITKQLTAAALLAEMERGAVIRRTGRPLTLDTETREIFPGVDHWSADHEHPVTVRRLLNMNSNLPNYTRRPPPGTDPWGTIPAAELMEKLKPLAQSGWPDTFEYSNTSYFLLSEIMELLDVPGMDAGGTSRDLVRHLVVEKAGLTDTGFTTDREPPAGRLASPGYKRKPVFHLGDWLKGSGDMVSNVLDLARWNVALMEGRVISPASRELMFADGARIGPNDWYGMGWFIAREAERDIYYHSGTVPGYTGFNAIVVPKAASGRWPRWISVTLLMNAENVEEVDGLAREIIDTVLLD